jgi:hypothetical protein
VPDVELLVLALWLLLSGDVGSVAAVLLRLPLVFSFVVLELELGLVLEALPYVDPEEGLLVPDAVAESLLELLEGEL